MNMITRCPACETSFRITEAQLNTAKGAVRCGSCLHIFRALDNLVQPRSEFRPATTTAAQKPPEKQPVPATKPSADTAVKPAAKARPAPEMARFEYRRPESAGIAPPRVGSAGLATKPAATSFSTAALHNQADSAAETRPVADWDREVAESDDLVIAAPDWESDEDNGIDSEAENRLRFDQAAIDAEDDEQGDLDDILISDEMNLEDETYADTGTSPIANFGDENFLPVDGWKPAESSLFDRGPRTPKRTDDYDEDFDPDESWAMDLLEEEEEELAKTGAAQPRTEARPPQEPFEPGKPADEDADEDDGHVDYSPARSASFAETSEDSDLDASGEPEHERWSSIWDDEEGYTQEQPAPLHAYSGTDPDDGHLDHSRSSLLSRIEPEPVEFAIAQTRDWRKTVLWGGLSALGLLVLIGQVAWLQFDQLSRQQPYRDFYGAVCPVIGCELPSLAAPDLIRTSNLVVRSHPQAEGALMVDTILLNRAPFEQPFPDLVLTFSDIHGQTLAARRFTPREYLAGELAGQTSMPSNQPIHLSLEIVDPGPDAVNYSAYIPQQ